jgi:hypothetical protein
MKQHAVGRLVRPLSGLAPSVDEALAEIDLLVAPDTKTAAKASRHMEGNQTQALAVLASSFDDALAEMAISVWR